MRQSVTTFSFVRIATGSTDLRTRESWRTRAQEARQRRGQERCASAIVVCSQGGAWRLGSIRPSERAKRWRWESGDGWKICHVPSTDGLEHLGFGDQLLISKDGGDPPQHDRFLASVKIVEFSKSSLLEISSHYSAQYSVDNIHANRQSFVLIVFYTPRPSKDVGITETVRGGGYIHRLVANIFSSGVSRYDLPRVLLSSSKSRLKVSADEKNVMFHKMYVSTFRVVQCPLRLHAELKFELNTNGIHHELLSCSGHFVFHARESNSRTVGL